MDFLKDAALPQSTEHFHLLLLILNLVYIVLFPYLGFLLGSAVLSLRCHRKGREKNQALYLRLSWELIETPLHNKTIPVFFGILPAFSLVFVYAQLLQSTPAISVGLMGYGFLALVLGATLLYTYKYTFRLGDILNHYKALLSEKSATGAATTGIVEYTGSNASTNLKAGRNGTILLFAAAFLCIAAVMVAGDPGNWMEIDSVFDLFVSPDVLVRYFQFIFLAFGITGVGMLFFHFGWQGGAKEADHMYTKLMRRVGLRSAVWGLLPQPMFIVLHVLLLPEQALSGLLFGLLGAGLVLLFLTAHFVYAYFKETRLGYTAYAFYTLAIALVLLFTSEQAAISSATRDHAVKLAAVYERETEELRARLGVAMVNLTGEEIYNARCSACHLFEEKKVGPPYRLVIAKYAGNREKLIAFVMNPVKVDPAYPPMPSQGLKPAEADSIVTFLLRKVTGK